MGTDPFYTIRKYLNFMDDSIRKTRAFANRTWRQALVFLIYFTR